MKKRLQLNLTQPFRKVFFLLVLLLAGNLPGTQAQVFKYAKGFGHSPFLDFGNSMAADAAGNAYYAGAFTNSLQIGTYSLNATGTNMYVAKFDPAGGVTWVKNFPNNSFFPGSIYDMAVDAAGNVFVTGAFEDLITIGTTTLDASLSLGPDLFLAKLDPAGNVVWVKHGTGNSNDEAYSLSLDGQGNIYLAGYSFSFAFTFGGQPLTGQGEGFVLKLNSLGQIVWSKRLDADFLDVATDAAGNGYLTGNFSSSTLNLGNNITVQHIGSGAFYTGFVAGFSASGQVQWASQIGGPGAEPNRVRVDPAGNALVLGTFLNSFSLGTFTLAGDPNRDDLFLIKLNNAGNLLWARGLENMGTNFSQSGFAADPMLELDAAGNPVVANGFYGTVRLAPNELLYPVSDTTSEIAIAKFTGNGSFMWAERIGGPGFDMVSGLAVAGNGNVFVSGEISNFATGNQTTHFGSNLTLSTTGDKAFVAGMLGAANRAGGTVFLDFNSSGTQDAGEPGVGQIGVSLQGSPLPILSNTNGRYTLYAESGTHQIGVPQVPTYFNLAPATQSVAFTGMGQADTLKHFALQPQVNQQDLEVNVAQVTAPRPGFTYRTRVTYRNAGTVPISGTVKLYSDTLLTFLNAAPVTNSVIADTLSWNFTSLQPLESRHVTVEWQVPVNAGLGSKLRMVAKVGPTAGDLTPDDNLLFFAPEVRGSFDPNDKLVSADFLTPAQVAARQPLVYTVRFQNTGTDTAFAVMVRDELSPLLDLSTFEVISASHPFNVKVAGPGMLEWRFPNILLPDSNVNEPGSHGYVQYRLKPVTTLSAGQHILTSAAIFFDFNAPVHTNVTDTEVSSALGLAANARPSALQGLKIWPNPAQESINVQFEAREKGDVQFRILNSLGQVVHQANYQNFSGTFRQPVSLERLPAGIYLVQVQQGGKSAGKQIIVQR